MEQFQVSNEYLVFCVRRDGESQKDPSRGMQLC